MKITIDGWLGFIAFCLIIFWAIALVVQMLAGRYWPKKIIKKYYAPLTCAGCGRPITEECYTVCSEDCKEIVKDQISE